MGTLCSSSRTAEHTSSIDLSQKQLTKLNELTNIPENDILIYYRQFMTISPNGRMTQAQFDDQLKMLRASTDRSQAIFRMIDKDNSGQISFQEYLQSIATFSQQSQPEQQLGTVFDTYQALSRQSLKPTSNELQIEGMTRNDIEHMLKRMHPRISQAEIDNLCNRYMDNDQNRNGYISKQEFIAACMKNAKLMEQLGHQDAVANIETREK
ncbi:unnamed protein product [Adineta ricciae]|uniref:EF-hand domain-containing protein n=1 Tax=Adineta ricciae TaxID=249248 RepID=A0A815ARG4_ADIRI|nr:unnamed protein product [Adineta ricciae]CAF1299015.1 unnamed protein product [Adineta ricciae]